MIRTYTLHTRRKGEDELLVLLRTDELPEGDRKTAEIPGSYNLDPGTYGSSALARAIVADALDREIADRFWKEFERNFLTETTVQSFRVTSHDILHWIHSQEVVP